MTSKYVMIPLIILIFFTFINSIATSNVINFSSQDVNAGNYNLGAIPIGLDGILAIMIGIVVVGAAIGFHLFGSGISDYSQAIIYKTMLYYSIWGVFSALSVGLITSIPFVGLFFWIGLTLFYSIGFQEQIGSHPS